jgi:hypothetical protein
MRRSFAAGVVALSSLLNLGCDDHGHSLGEEACEHFAEGPVDEVTAGASVDAPVDGGREHARVDLTLGVVEEEAVGYIAFATEAGDHAFYFDAAVALELTDASGAAVPVLTSGATDLDCGSVRQWFTFALADGIYTARIAADAATTAVSMVRMSVDGGHDH